MGRITRRTSQKHPERQDSVAEAMLREATASPQFLPFIYGGIAICLLSFVAVRLLEVDPQWIAVLVGGTALLGFGAYACISARRARRRLAEKRAELFRQLEESKTNEP